MAHGVGGKIDTTVGELKRHLQVELSRTGMSRNTVPIQALWLRNIGGKAQVLAEVETRTHGRKWYLILEESLTGAFSHIAEVEGILNSPEDPLTKERSL